MAVLTGAGVSAESGVPTFRGENGLWRSYKPEDLATPEAFARERGCTQAKLDTFTFQAGPRFYEHLGWEVFGVIDDHPPGHRHYFMRKSLVG